MKRVAKVDERFSDRIAGLVRLIKCLSPDRRAALQRVVNETNRARGEEQRARTLAGESEPAERGTD
jgi:hypothetical protein